MRVCSYIAVIFQSAGRVRVLLLSLLLLLSFLILSLLSSGCLLPHEILPMKVTAEYELDK